MANTTARSLIAAALVLFALPARASELGTDGHIHFAPDALASLGFEGSDEVAAAGAWWLSWSSTGQLTWAAWTDASSGTLESPADPLQGSHALRVGGTSAVALALQIPALVHGSGRVNITFWGRAEGAEPVLEVVYGPARQFYVVAIRTGRETSDGWAEFSTGPIDSAVWGLQVVEIDLTIQRTTSAGYDIALSSEMSPAYSDRPKELDLTASALFDALEVRPEGGTSMPESACTQADVATTCGTGGTCMLGHCLDGVYAWGPLPATLQQRKDLLSRQLFFYAHILADRQATAGAAATFEGALAAIAQATTSADFYVPLNALVAQVRDSHTTLGDPPTWDSWAWPRAYADSGPLDVCFGLALNDLGGETVPGYAVYSVAAGSAVAGSLRTGDVVVSVDGVPVADWVESYRTRFVYNLPNDPSADPTSIASDLSSLVGMRASSLVVARCSSGGGCVQQPAVKVADLLWAEFSTKGRLTGYSRNCTPRFIDAVKNPGAYDSGEVVVEAGTDGITYVEFDGFEPASSTDFKNSFTSAFATPGKVLVDAREGPGGQYALGKWLIRLLRGSEDPFASVALPRNGYDVADDPWLFSTDFDVCADPASTSSTPLCQWGGSNDILPTVAGPAGAASTIAWVDGWDVSMNDITPRSLQGRAELRIFGPHPSHGAYGEITKLEPLLGTWYPGSVQILDTRFGAALADAKAARWESGHGVVPDQVVVQTVSDILAARDTALEAARAWLEAQ
jgi:hypothetical protein